MPFCWFAQLFLFHLLSRLMSYTAPWNRLVPLFVTAEICMPLDLPNSA